MSMKLLLQTLRVADGGKVVCEVSAPDGSVVQGVIDQSFFEDFTGTPRPQLTPQRQSRIVEENISYLEAEAQRLWDMGSRELVIK